MVHAELALVTLAGLLTALATGLGALPFFFLDDVNDRLNVALWGFASGIMLAASIFGLATEGLAAGGPLALGVGLAVGVALVVASDRALSGTEIHPRKYEEAGFKKLVLILGVLTVHSFPEGVAIGVSFADLPLGEGVSVLGLTVPVLAVFITGAIAIQNVPEGIAVAIPLQGLGVPRWRMVWWAVFSSLPQPIGAALAYAFVRTARDFLAVGFGFAAGAMIYLVFSELVPEARSIGRDLPRNGTPELAIGLFCGVLLMLPVSFV
ncbi:ZIP family metal transporter [Halalkalicoccus sp. NIPERK01]|uniref:ZIP family metal transporter n=1 Tax=Halalkalicoccus sp. NIPERK01 TaxID=3053469 RepID=UPI00256EC120|nr:ZIP family metal transporter [Halalkalicoccus sp. NIPERK01]MDL5361610.1 ZIP family metal transporter [Halalkalicoccus sp. NIPERK01]